LNEAEAKIRKTHDGKGALGAPMSNANPREERRAAIAPVVNRVLTKKK